MESTSVTQIERILYFLELPQQLRPRPLIRQCGSYSPKTASKNVSLPCLLFLTSRVGFILSRSLNSVPILWLPGPIECSKRGYFGKPNFDFLTLGGLNHDVRGAGQRGHMERFWRMRHLWETESSWRNPENSSKWRSCLEHSSLALIWLQEYEKLQVNLQKHCPA